MSSNNTVVGPGGQSDAKHGHPHAAQDPSLSAKLIEMPTLTQIRVLRDELCRTHSGNISPITSQQKEEVLRSLLALEGEDRNMLWQKAAQPQYKNRMFTIFASLPIELRLRIWELACEEGRIIDFLYHDDGSDIVNPERRGDFPITYTGRYPDNPHVNKPHGVMLACKESHVVATRRMIRLCKKTWVNLESDVLLVYGTRFRGFARSVENLLDRLHMCRLTATASIPCPGTSCLKNHFTKVREIMIEWRSPDIGQVYSVDLVELAGLPNLEKVTFRFTQYVGDGRLGYVYGRPPLVEDLENRDEIVETLRLRNLVENFASLWKQRSMRPFPQVEARNLWSGYRLQEEQRKSPYDQRIVWGKHVEMEVECVAEVLIENWWEETQRKVSDMLAADTDQDISRD